jgi:hypothetical protein
MSRPPKGRHPAIANRLAQSLDGQLADIASTMGALDLDADPVAGAAPDAVGDADAAPMSVGPDIPADGNPGEPPAPPPLDFVLDEFEGAMGAMLEDKERALARRRIDENTRPIEDGP